MADWLSRPETLGAAYTLNPDMDPEVGAVTRSRAALQMPEGIAR